MQFHPRANVSIQNNTGNVPSDGKYYVTRDKKIIAAFRSLKAATSYYQELIDEMALPPVEEKESKISYGQMMDDYFIRTSNNKLLGTSFGFDNKKKARFNKAK